MELKKEYVIFNKGTFGYSAYKGSRKDRHLAFVKDRKLFKVFKSEELAKESIEKIKEDFNKSLLKNGSMNIGFAMKDFSDNLFLENANSKYVDLYLSCNRCTRCSSECPIRRGLCN